jgi:hypothetical protein
MKMLSLKIRMNAKRVKDDKLVELEIIINKVTPEQTLGELVRGNRDIFDIFEYTELEIDKEKYHIYRGSTAFIK